jgi:hypothetical protein
MQEKKMEDKELEEMLKDISFEDLREEYIRIYHINKALKELLKLEWGC